MNPGQSPELVPHTQEDFERLEAERKALPPLIREERQEGDRHNEAEVYLDNTRRRLNATQEMLEEFPAMNFMGGNMLLAPKESIHPGEELTGMLESATGIKHPPRPRDEYDSDSSQEPITKFTHQQLEQQKPNSEAPAEEVQTPPAEPAAPDPRLAVNNAWRDRVALDTIRELKDLPQESEGGEGELLEAEEAMEQHWVDTDHARQEHDSRKAQWQRDTRGNSGLYAEYPPINRPQDPVSVAGEPPVETSPELEQAQVAEVTVASSEQDRGATQPQPNSSEASPKFKERLRKLTDGIVKAFFNGDELPRADVGPMRRAIESMHVHYTELSERLIADEKQPALTRELLSHPEARPVVSVKIAGKDFLLSSIMQPGPGYKAMALAYTELQGGRMAPRLFWRSDSSGEWRVANYTKRDGWFAKGLGKLGYTTQTKLNPLLADYLDKLEVVPQVSTSRLLQDGAADLFLLDRQDKEAINTYRKESVLFNPNKALAKQLERFGTIGDFGAKDEKGGQLAADYYEQLATPFDEPLQQAFEAGPLVPPVVKRHSLLGEYLQEIYEVEMPVGWLDSGFKGSKELPHTIRKNDFKAARRLRFSFCYDRTGRVWIDNILYVDAPTTSYGNTAWHLDAQVLTNKPLEYRDKVERSGLRNGVDYTGSPVLAQRYADITPLIDRLPIVKAFRSARGIARQPQKVDLPTST